GGVGRGGAGRGDGRGGRRRGEVGGGHRDGGRRREVSGGVIGAGGETVGAIAHAGGRPRVGEGGRGQGGDELAVPRHSYRLPPRPTPSARWSVRRWSRSAASCPQPAPLGKPHPPSPPRGRR